MIDFVYSSNIINVGETMQNEMFQGITLTIRIKDVNPLIAIYNDLMPARASPSLITFQFYSLVVSLSDIFICFYDVFTRYLALKGLIRY